MKSQSNFNLNWSGNVKANPRILFPKNIQQLKTIINKKKFIASGNNRSFGDNSINSNLVVSMKNFNRVISFNYKNGIIEIESGVLLKDVLNLVLKKRWFVPVTPGTKYVSIGGMIANNVHGKNTFKNQIKYHIKEIKLLTLNKKIIICSKNRNKKIFEMTVGGFGLTGFILSAKIKLKKINSIYMKQTITEFNNYDEFFNLIKKSKKHEYNVNWIDNFDLNQIKGLCYSGNHLNDEISTTTNINFSERKISPLHFLFMRVFTQNYFLIKITKFIFRKIKKFFYRKKCNFNDFFYPQDYFINWNKIYGKRGFFQVQFLSKEKDFVDILDEISLFFTKEKVFSTFIIIKKFDEKGKYLNFYGKGFSISMDMPINSKFVKTKRFFNSLFTKYKIKINFSKDLICNKKVAESHDEYVNFKKNLNLMNRNRKLNSLFSKRLKI